ncbi:MAG: hypothetical protein ACKO5K_06935 [Armatimonadota bacterium]
MSSNDDSDPSAQAQPGLSRRDFLRSAGREAAQTGARLVPGASLMSAGNTTPWWKRIAGWRRVRSAGETQPHDKEETQDNAASDS